MEDARFCPHCEYDLTGLTANRCPECGEPFNREEIARLAREASKPISTPMIALQLLALPVILCALLVLSGWSGLEFLYGTFAISYIPAAIVVSINLSKRLKVTAARERGGCIYSVKATSPAWFVLIALTVLQLAIGAHAAALALWVIY